jgi:4-hydroxy-4-methyl-2-oxoglutarate aldolase
MTILNKELLKQLAEFDTPLLANTVAFIDSTPAHEFYMGGSIQSVTPQLGPTVGVAYTIELDSSTPEGDPDLNAYWRQMEAIENEDLPVMWVVKTVGSRSDHECVIGDGMAKSLYAAGCVGLVTDGGVRDVRGLLTVPFAAYCRGQVIHHCNLRFRREGSPVEIGGITITTGDVLHADSGGVIRIPHTCVEDLPDKAIRMQAFERDAHMCLRRSDLRFGEKRVQVQELLAKYGFAKAKAELR